MDEFDSHRGESLRMIFVKNNWLLDSLPHQLLYQFIRHFRWVLLQKGCLPHRPALLFFLGLQMIALWALHLASFFIWLIDSLSKNLKLFGRDRLPLTILCEWSVFYHPLSRVHPDPLCLLLLHLEGWDLPVLLDLLDQVEILDQLV